MSDDHVPVGYISVIYIYIYIYIIVYVDASLSPRSTFNGICFEREIDGHRWDLLLTRSTFNENVGHCGGIYF